MSEFILSLELEISCTNQCPVKEIDSIQLLDLKVQDQDTRERVDPFSQDLKKI